MRNYTQKFKMTSLTMEARILEALKKLDLLGRPILKFSMNLLSVISVSDQSRSKLEMIGSFMQIVILLKSPAELLSEVNFWWKMVFSMNSSILSLKSISLQALLVASTGRNVYNDGNSVEIMVQSTWSYAAPLPAFRYYAPAATLHNSVSVFGNYNYYQWF